jgi:hypothetical protein
MPYDNAHNAYSGSPESLDGVWRYTGGRVTAPANAATAQIQLISHYNTGWVAFDDVLLTRVGQDTVIKRSSYGIAGQMIATRVSGDPVGGNNGLFYVYSDHLGSSSVLVNSSNNTVVNGSRTWYLPFGGYRPGSKQPGDCVVVGGVGYSDPGTVAQQVESAARQLAKEGDTVAPYVAEYAQEVWQLEETLEQTINNMSQLDQNMKRFDNVYYYVQETTFETLNGDLSAQLTDDIVENRVPPTTARSGVRLFVRGVAELGESGLKWMILGTNYATNAAEHLGTEATRAGLTAVLLNAKTEYGTAVRALQGAIRLKELNELRANPE